VEVELPRELEAVRKTVRDFVQRELEPIAEEIDRTGEVPPRLRPLLARNGYLGMRIPEEYGGAEISLFAYCLTMEEFSRSHRVFTIVSGESSGLTPMAIVRHGTEEQKRKYLPGLANGTISTAFALTEPSAGSDAAAIQTRAVPDRGGFVLNGTKHFINGGHEADFVMVMAVTDPEKRARGGITSFLVDQGTPGFSVTRVETTIGSEAIKLAELSFEDCWVPESAVLGNVGDGFKFAMESLAQGRMSVSCACIGTADRLLEMMVSHAKSRYTFGKPLAERQAIQWMIADSAVELTAARAMTYETLRQIEAGKEKSSVGPGMCKLFCSEMVGRVADRAVQIHGGMGVIRGFPVERFYRDIRHYRVGEGTSEMQRHIISRSLLKD